MIKLKSLMNIVVTESMDYCVTIKKEVLRIYNDGKELIPVCDGHKTSSYLSQYPCAIPLRFSTFSHGFIYSFQCYGCVLLLCLISTLLLCSVPVMAIACLVFTAQGIKIKRYSLQDFELITHH